MNTATTPNAAALLSQPWPEKPLTKQEKLQKWLDAQKAMAEAKDAEMEARKAVVADYIDPTTGLLDGKKEGTVNIPLANNWKLKVVLKQNYNLSQADIDAALDKMEKTGENGKFIAERLVSWKAALSVKEYRLLSDAHKAIIDNVLTITDGSPSLELVDPDAKKK